MDPRPTKPVEDLLIDRHLGQIDEDDRAWLAARADRDDSLRGQDEAAGRILQRLDAHWVAPAPSNLTEKVLRHVEANRAEAVAEPARSKPAGAVHPGKEPAILPGMTPASDGGYSGRTVRFSLRDLLAVAACIGLFLGVLIPTMQRLHSHARRVQCVGNLESISQALSAYGREFGGALPHAGTLMGASWLYAPPGGAPHLSNSRHPYLLVGFGYLPQESKFRCPSSAAPIGDESHGLSGATDPARPAPASPRDDFLDPASCSYDSLNMAGAAPNLFDAPQQAYMSDANPLFVSGVFRESVNPNSTNSPLHDAGTGQNVLQLDGSVNWLTSPFRTRRDNLWLAGDLHRYTGTEAQSDADDAFLVPATPAPKAGRRNP
ncbi:MAG: hypothetical protein IT449_08625 [Phycisphaerales bacterium]|nr:hypothetical protein [Phycisphaerales bacterium]